MQDNPAFRLGLHVMGSDGDIALHPAIVPDLEWLNVSKSSKASSVHV